MDRYELVEALYNTYQNLMFCVAKGILKDHHLAEDVVHECIIRLIKAKVLKIDDLHAAATRKLVQVVARNQAYRQYNKYHKGEQCTLDMNVFTDNASVNFSVYTEFAEFLQTLSPMYREVILLRIYYGYSYKQIGVLMDLRPQTARNYMAKVRKLIRREWDGGESDA